MTESERLPGRIVGHEPGAFYNRLADALRAAGHHAPGLRRGRLCTWNPENAASSLTRDRLQVADRRYLGRDAPGRG